MQIKIVFNFLVTLVLYCLSSDLNEIRLKFCVKWFNTSHFGGDRILFDLSLIYYNCFHRFSCHIHPGSEMCFIALFILVAFLEIDTSTTHLCP